MNSMTDQYYSRLLSIARQNKNIRFIKNVKDDLIEVELTDGSAEWLPWDTVMNFRRLMESKEIQNK